MSLEVQAYQFLSRTNVAKRALGRLRTSPAQRPNWVWELEISVEDKPFEINFAQIPASGSSIGAYQHVDHDVDVYMSRRWPVCLSMVGTVTLSPSSIDRNGAVNLLEYTRKVLWTPHGQLKSAFASIYAPDQVAAVLGYRREFMHLQIFDIMGARRPSRGLTFAETDVGEPIGPGVITLPRLDHSVGINELVWSQILPFPNRTEISSDKQRIGEILSALRRHYNGYNELQDAQRHVSNTEIKAAVRSAASAVEAVLRFYCDLWVVPYPSAALSFDRKIERILRTAGRPSYGSVNPNGLELLLYLYRSRNAMHEGDVYYRDRNGTEVRVRRLEQVEEFVKEVEDFVLWIDSLA